ncbi:enoyl-CoA hydratase/isomerase family protein [Rhizomonospora bruguierae]|uniref:enoyl-CoA hydratase/isomerase family protein n=1 Tax=Rhizomonospora bruguierae TaxID=1581705 RepID=UPI001BCDA597|nr:enoyl-CoA hydratase/isomerase family protein [Micromonospora sp. NBRC 107566]
MTVPNGLTVNRDGPVATITLDRPEVLNAQTPAMWSALREIGTSLPGDIRVVIVRGAGRSFSAGIDLAVAKGAGNGDLATLARLPARECAERIAGYQEAFTWLRRPDLITVAAVQGHAIGAGFQLALNCDLRVLADDAQFAMAEVTLGQVPDLGGTKRLTELVGYARALELCATARRVGAAEAERLGLATVVVPRAELETATADLVAALLAGARDAVVEIKALLAGAAGRSYAEQDRAEREAQTRRLSDLFGAGE